MSHPSGSALYLLLASAALLAAGKRQAADAGFSGCLEVARTCPTAQ